MQEGDNFQQTPASDHGFGDSYLSSNFFMGHVGEVVLTHTGNGISWNLIDPIRNDECVVPCFRMKFVSDEEQEAKFADIYCAEIINQSSNQSFIPNSDESMLHKLSEMHCFRVHVVQKSKTHSSLWRPSVYTFGNKNLEICILWVKLINAHLNVEATRPTNLLVFVHPRSGKKHGCRIWEMVAPLFTHAGVKTKVIVTERAGHARDLLVSMPDSDLRLYDGCVAVGGDGFFNEILNGVLSSRHKAPYPPAPWDFAEMPNNDSSRNVEPIVSETCDHSGEDSPLLTRLGDIEPLPARRAEDSDFKFPNRAFRFGIIPSGSTDAIVICTTGVRDPVTSALHIILGKRVDLDIAQLVRWRKTRSSVEEEEEACIRYAASFAGYGFYGDVVSESEKLRWMGPKRYDVAGTKVFLEHRSYEAEVDYLEVESEKPGTRGANNCRANCSVCSSGSDRTTAAAGGRKWSRSRGSFLSIGAAIISCRNEKAPDGLVAEAHLSDGFLHLLLIRDCPRPSYLWHLIQIARRGGDPLDFRFIEHHKTPVFTFKSLGGKEGVWNVDGEIFSAHQLSAQVFRGLVSLFATGP